MMRKSRLGQETLQTSLSRRGFLVMGAGGTAAFLAGCGGGEGLGSGASKEGVGGFTGGKYTGPAVTLDYWNGFTGGDGPTMDALVKKYNSSPAKVTVKQTTIEWADFYQKLPAAAQAGKGPHFGAMHLDQIATNAARQVIVPIDDVASELGLSAGDFAPAVWQPAVYGGSRYGIPFDVHCLAMYWNQEHFDKAGISSPPTDAASFDEACQKLQQAGYKTPFWMPNQWPAHLMFLSLLWQHGGEPYAADGSAATFDDQAGVAALTWMTEQIDKGYSPPNVDIDAQYLAFKNGETSITWDGIWQINDLKAGEMDFGIAPIPTIGDQPAVWANSHNFFVTALGAEDQNAANASKAFISWISKQSAEWAGAAMIPARNSARKEPAYTKSPQYALNDYLGNLHFLPAVPGLGDVQIQTLEPALNEAILGKTPPDEALSTAASNATELIKANLEKYGA